ncbi:MAG TPA: lysophospholipid acyltransferase family protein [Planctomycetota bacterium]|nr:lysophospholipid acyltransferase family protein [Planctomycetota bacterium]
MTRWWWWACQWVIRLVGLALWRIRASGVENIPRRGGCLLAANHQSFLDPPLVAAFLPREMHFMARRSLFQNPAFRALIVRCNAFPIERDTADVKGVKLAIGRLEAGNLLLVFPEGTRTRDGTVGRMKAGIGVLAERAAVPIVPVLIEGAHRVWPKGRWLPGLGSIRIRFGRPLPPGATEGTNAADRLREAIVALKTGERTGCRTGSSSGS